MVAWLAGGYLSFCSVARCFVGVAWLQQCCVGVAWLHVFDMLSLEFNIIVKFSEKKGFLKQHFLVAWLRQYYSGCAKSCVRIAWLHGVAWCCVVARMREQVLGSFTVWDRFETP